MDKKRKKVCRIKGCSKPSRTDDVCNTHYSGFYRAVKAGEVTWDELEAAGLIKRLRRRSNTKELIALAVKGSKDAKDKSG